VRSPSLVRSGAIPLLGKEGARGWLTREIFLALSALGERVWSLHICPSVFRPRPDSGPLPVQIPALAPLGERVARPGVFTSRGGTGEGVEPPQAADSLENENVRLSRRPRETCHLKPTSSLKSAHFCTQN